MQASLIGIEQSIYVKLPKNLKLKFQDIQDKNLRIASLSHRIPLTV